MSSLMGYSPCAACCTCTGVQQSEVRGAPILLTPDFSYSDFLHPTTGGTDAGRRFFLSQTARGLATSGFGIGGHWVRFATTCSYTGDSSYAGSSLIEIWNAVSGAPGAGEAFFDDNETHSFQHGTPFDTVSDCAGDPPLFPTFGFSLVIYYDLVSETSAQAANVTGIPNPRFKPVGENRLFNELFTADWLAIGMAYADADTWREADVGDPSVSRFTDPTDSGSISWAYSIGRRRWSFPIPLTGGGWQVSFDIIWTPEGGSPETYDTVVHVWDRAVPSGYDRNDSGTWPVTPWFELPAPTEPGTYTVDNIAFACGPTVAPGTPGDVFASAL